MTKKFCIAVAIFALLAVTAPVHATTIQWDLVNVTDTEGDGLSFTGFFDFNGNGFSSNYSLTVSGWQPTPVTATPSNSALNLASSQSSSGFALVPNGGGIVCCGDTGVSVNGPLDGSVPALSIISGESYFYTAPGVWVPLEGSIQEASVSATPLPPALPLFGSALLALAGFAAYRSRRDARG